MKNDTIIVKKISLKLAKSYKYSYQYLSPLNYAVIYVFCAPKSSISSVASKLLWLIVLQSVAVISFFIKILMKNDKTVISLEAN